MWSPHSWLGRPGLQELTDPRAGAEETPHMAPYGQGKQGLGTRTPLQPTGLQAWGQGPAWAGDHSTRERGLRVKMAV